MTQRESQNKKMPAKKTKDPLPKKPAKLVNDQVWEFGPLIRTLREEKKLSGAELCRQAGGMDPRLLNALEKGRIQNPSFQTLSRLARVLTVTLADFFTIAEARREECFSAGSQRGNFSMEFPSSGARIVSFTPFIKDFFCGKIFLGAKKKFDQGLLKHPCPQFVSVMLGQFIIQAGDKKIHLREGQNLFFNGALKHTVLNPLHRESVLMLVTAPSFL